MNAKTLKRNYIFNILDGSFFGLGLGLASFTTVIPLFISSLTDSAILIGMVAAVHSFGWQLPQLLTARRVSSLTRFKPMVMWMTIHERIPFLGFALVALLVPVIGKTAALVLAFILLTWQSVGGGLTGNPWQNMVGKVIPPHLLGSFFGVQSSAMNLSISVTAIFAGLALERYPYPFNYALCFGVCAIFLVLSFLMLNMTVEDHHEIQPAEGLPPSIWKSTLAILKTNHNFAWFLIARCLIQFGFMASAFYVVYAVRTLSASEATTGILTSVLTITQMIANPSLGWLADRWSRKQVLTIGAVATALSAFLAWWATDLGWYYLVMVFIGLGNAAYWSIYMAMTLDFGSGGDRPTYVGMANTLIAPATFISPLVGGWLADSAGYQSTFFVAGIAAILTAVILATFVHDPRAKAQTAAV